jgi:hypothetical protein
MSTHPVSSTKKLFWLFLSPRFSFSFSFLREWSCVLKVFECSVRTVRGVCKWNPTSCVRDQKRFTDMNPIWLIEFGSLYESDYLELEIRFTGGSRETQLWPWESPYLAFSNRLLKGLPMCYPRLPAGSGLLTIRHRRSLRSSHLFSSDWHDFVVLPLQKMIFWLSSV